MPLPVTPPLPKTRRNSFYEDRGEDRNRHPVIYARHVEKESIGFRNPEFFAALGHLANPVGSDARNAEQEYLLQNMVKGAMYEASRIADRFGVGIAVRGTGLLAHMGIESGDPTKAQEFKNKTSKGEDLFLCDELDWAAIGAVVHYDPRIHWTSRSARIWRTTDSPTEKDWRDKKQHILDRRIPQLRKSGLQPRIQWPVHEADWEAIKKTFFKRVKEYHDEDALYRRADGRFFDTTLLVGPYIRMKLRPDVNMYGDHDLFCFTVGDYGHIVHDRTGDLPKVQRALQEANTFQAQHGGIWNWNPSGEWLVGIRKAIMAEHSPNDGNPLVYIRPNGEVTAAFHVPGPPDRLVSAWVFYPDASKWLRSTYSGRKLLGKHRR